MDQAPSPPVPPLRREVELPASRAGLWGPVAALTTIMFLSIASAVAVMVPRVDQLTAWDQNRDQQEAARLRFEVESRPTSIEELPVHAVETDRALLPCRGPVYRAGADGQSEMVFEVCAGAILPTEFVE